MSGNVRVAKVALDKVAFHPHNIRRDLGDLRSLAASIKRFGVMQPVVVEQYGDALRLRAGHRRLAAARLAGATRIPALIHDEALEDDEWLVASVQENVMRRGLDEEERHRAIDALRQLGCTWEGIGEAFGVTGHTARNWCGAGSAGGVKPVGSRVGKDNRGRGIRATTARTFVARWRDEAERRDVTAQEVLDALEAVTYDGLLHRGLPDEVAHRRMRRGAS